MKDAHCCRAVLEFAVRNDTLYFPLLLLFVLRSADQLARPIVLQVAVVEPGASGRSSQDSGLNPATRSVMCPRLQRKCVCKVSRVEFAVLQTGAHLSRHLSPSEVTNELSGCVICVDGSGDAARAHRLEGHTTRDLFQSLVTRALETKDSN